MSGNEGSAAATQSGRLVGGRYRLVHRLGAGGFGSVWQARDEVLGVEVAVKEVRLPPTASAAEQAERLARAQREARHAARLRDHPNVVGVHDVVVDDGVPWTVMQLIVGRSLEEQVARHGPLDPAQAARVGAAVLTALGAAHQAGIVHRDVKPANILLADDGRVLLADFGIAVQRDDTALTATGAFIGSVEYLAPERARGQDAGPAGDLFSLGATLYYAVEGRAPFRRDSPAATLTAVLFDTPEPPQRAGALAGLITGLLAKDPATRLTGPQVAALLASLPNSAPPYTPTAPGTTTPPGHTKTATAPGVPGQQRRPVLPPDRGGSSDRPGLPPDRGGSSDRPGIRHARSVLAGLAPVVLLLLCGVALPLRGVVLHLPSGVAHGSVGLPVYQVLGLDRFLALGLPRIVLPWPWLLAPVAALLLGAVLIHHRHAALRVSAYALALVLPARLLAADLTLRPSDLVHGLPQVLADTTTVSFGPGWWLVHAAALFSVAALAWEDLRPAR